MKINKPISKPILLGFMCLVTVGFFIFQLNSYYEQNEIKKHKVEVIGKVIDQYRTSKLHPYIRYEYTFEGETYQNIKSIDRKSKNYINKYFLVYISERKPKYSSIQLNKEVKQ